MTHTYTYTYTSPLGDILIATDTIGLYGLWFKDQKYYAKGLQDPYKEELTPLIQQVINWLDAYFKGLNPPISFPLHLIGTPYQKQVWQILTTIPYGQTTTYKQIALMIAKERGTTTYSSQAVGGAVGHNLISIIIPCHRVIGTNGSLTGYAGGIERKTYLLKLEKVL